MIDIQHCLIHRLWLIHDNEKFSDKDATRVKNILLHIMRYGMKLPLLKKLQMGLVLLKYKLSIDQAAKLYETYVGKWGLESLTYRFEGIKDQVVVVTETKGSSYENNLVISKDDDELFETETYETTRVVVQHLDHNSNSLLYSNEVLNISVKGPLDLIGPSSVSLIGGSIGLFFKTKGVKGKATITVKSNNFEEQKISIQVK